MLAYSLKMFSYVWDEKDPFLNIKINLQAVYSPVSFVPFSSLAKVLVEYFPILIIIHIIVKKVILDQTRKVYFHEHPRSKRLSFLSSSFIC